MKVIVNKYIPFGNFTAINLCGIIFSKKPLTKRQEIHEQIHIAQMLEMLVIFFYLWYVIEFLIRLCCYLNWNIAYRSISLEREAYGHEYFQKYLKQRKHFRWTKYLCDI